MVNIINPEAVDKYLRPIAEESPWDAGLICHWLKITLRQSILNRSENAVKIIDLPNNAPEWLQNKWDVTGQDFYEFKPDIELTDKVRHIKDWLVSAREHNADFLSDKDDTGRPKRLLHLTLETAYEAADEYFRKLNDDLEVSEKNDDTKAIMELDDGYKVVKLQTQNALDYESKEMGHCIGHGSYDHKLKKNSGSIFYSLRDQNNNPHVTFEVDTKNNALVQCKGKENKAPVSKYFPYVQDFVKQKNFELKEYPAHTGLIKQNGKYYNFYNLPEDFVIEEDLFLFKLNQDITFPKGLTVKGGVQIYHNKGKVCFEGVLTSTNNLIVGNTEDEVSFLGNTYIGGDMEVSNISSKVCFKKNAEVQKRVYITHNKEESLKINGTLSMKGGIEIHYNHCPIEIENIKSKGWGVSIKDNKGLVSVEGYVITSHDLSVLDSEVNFLGPVEAGNGISVYNYRQDLKIEGKVMHPPISSGDGFYQTGRDLSRVLIKRQMSSIHKPMKP